MYLPGVSIPTGGSGFPMFQRGHLIALCTQENAAVCIIGRATMSSADMLLRAALVILFLNYIREQHLYTRSYYIIKYIFAYPLVFLASNNIYYFKFYTCVF